jgi:hyperosmotically inducible periplasmic protein
MRAAIGTVVVAAAAVLVAGQVPMRAAAPQAPTSTTTSKTPDSATASKIEKRINGSSLKKYDIKVSVNDGVATLSGTVATEGDRRRAAQLATTDGVSRVDNQLVVDLNAGTAAKGTTGKAESNIDKGAEKTKKGVDKAIDKTKEGAGTAWEKSKEGASKAADKSAQGVGKAGEAITDTYIKTRVKSKFLDEDLLKNSDIAVDVTDHVVTLSGTVPTEAGRARAIEEAKKVEGVHQVIDRMTIGPKK